MDPTFWGPSGWRFIHSVCYTAPEALTSDDKERYKTFIKALGAVLPCAACRKHFQENLKRHPLENALGTRKALFEWSVDMHNEVNRKTGKMDFSYLEAEEALFIKPFTSGLDVAIGGKSYKKRIILYMIVLLLLIIAMVAVSRVVRHR